MALLLFASGCTLIDLSRLQGGDGSSGVGASSPCGEGTCSIHGRCQASSSEASCVCDGHFDGPSCAACAVGYTGDDCLACDVGFQDGDDNGTCVASCDTLSCGDIGICEEKPDGAVCSCFPGNSGQGCATPCAPGTSGSDCEFQIVYSVDLPATGETWIKSGDVPYGVDESGNVGGFSRVAYMLVLDDQRVWVEMDAFTEDAALLGVPVDWIWNMPVTHVLVRSLAPNQPNVVTPSSGGLEFWSDCYAEGDDGMYDSHDVLTGTTDCYGSMQVSVDDAIVFAFNAWAKADPIDIGIGPSTAGNSRDWTFAGDGGDFAVRRLEVYVKP